MLLFVLALFTFVFRWTGIDVSFPFSPDLSTICFTVVNAACFFFMARLLRSEGRSLKALVGYRKDLLGQDILFGILWVLVLYVPFAAALMGTMFLMHGSEFIDHFETVFAGDAEQFAPRPRGLTWFAAVISLLFPFLNAPIEEIMYRGYAQNAFIERTKQAWLGIVIPSFGFAVQHFMLAASMQGAIAYAAAFFIWGVGSGIIYNQQGRLMPLIICHFIVNIAFSILPILFLLRGNFV